MYGKHFESTYTGSMCGSGVVVFAVWGYVIANTRPDSMVEVHPSHLARIFASKDESVDELEESIESALETLCTPDPKSRSKDKDGRRLIQEGEHLYRVVNHMLYRGIQNTEGLREYNRIKKRESRAREKAKKDSV